MLWSSLHMSLHVTRQFFQIVLTYTITWKQIVLQNVTESFYHIALCGIFLLNLCINNITFFFKKNLPLMSYIGLIKISSV